jgi:hypothetical protein
LSICSNANAQIKKRFINEDGKTVKKASRANKYILYESSGDTLWNAATFDMQNYLVQKGSFLDSALTIRQGRFTYYTQTVVQRKIDEHHSSIDTEVYPCEMGYFVNGLKEGTWMYYGYSKIIEGILEYKNNELNGLYEKFDGNGKIMQRSYYNNGGRVGDSYYFRPDSSIEKIFKFRDGTFVSEKDYPPSEQMFGAGPHYDFIHYIRKNLKKYKLPLLSGMVVIEFTVTTDGILTNPKVLLGVSPELDKSIIDIVNTCPRWGPATLNKKPVEQKLTLDFYCTVEE